MDLTSVQIVAIDGNGILRPLATNAQTTSGGGAVTFNALLLQAIGNQAGATPNVITSASDGTDAVVIVGTGATNGFAGMLVVSRNTIFNGATWDRAREVTGDAQAKTGIPVSHVTLWNGATYDRSYSASAANVAAQSGVGAQLVAAPGAWSAFSAPGAGAQATATKAAGAAGVRHVITTLAAILSDAAANQQINLVIRDGASGVGTILWELTMCTSTAAGPRTTVFSISGLNIPGSAATAMTVEFVAAGAGTTFESVSFTGYDAS